MADKTQFQPQNPYALFSPDQWSNQFSNFNNKALPWPSSYAGMPTDAMGNPIQPPPGMTINNSAPTALTPAAPTAETYGLQPSQLSGPSALNPTGNQAFGMANWGGMMSPQANELYRNQQFSSPGQAQGSAPMSNQAFAGQQGAGTAAPTGPTYPQILSMLANPGKVTTPGATVPATASAQPGPGSLQAFLQNWQPAQSGPGSGFQQGFGNALKGMGY